MRPQEPEKKGKHYYDIKLNHRDIFLILFLEIFMKTKNLLEQQRMQLFKSKEDILHKSKDDILQKPVEAVAAAS